MSRLPRLDVLRGSAILGVLVYHWVGAASGRPHLGWSGDWIDLGSIPSRWFMAAYPLVLGNAGVMLFFLLSGYLIHSGGLRSFRLGSFFWKRFWRIYPAYVVAVIAFSSSAWHPSGVGRRDLVAHLLLIHNFSKWYFWGINGSFWSLAVEWQFYLVYPALFLLRRRVGMDRCLALSWLIAAVATVLAYATTPTDRIAYPRVWLSPAISWSAWVLGAWIAEKHRQSDRPAIPRAGWVAFGSMVALVVTECFRPASVLILAPAGLAAVALDRYGRRLGPLHPVETAVGHLGTISYSVYLFHQPLMLWVTKRWHYRDEPFAAWHLAAFVPVFVACVAVGWVSYHVLERGGEAIGRFLAPRAVQSPALRAPSDPTPGLAFPTPTA